MDRRAIVGALRGPMRRGAAPRRRAGRVAARRVDGRWHPRWPSSSCAAAHFGSWGEAPASTWIPAFESSVAERVESAQRLAAGGAA